MVYYNLENYYIFYFIWLSKIYFVDWSFSCLLNLSIYSFLFFIIKFNYYTWSECEVSYFFTFVIWSLFFFNSFCNVLNYSCVFLYKFLDDFRSFYNFYTFCWSKLFWWVSWSFCYFLVDYYDFFTSLFILTISCWIYFISASLESNFSLSSLFSSSNMASFSYAIFFYTFSLSSNMVFYIYIIS